MVERPGLRRSGLRTGATLPNYRMKLTSSAIGLLGGTATLSSACSLARARLGAQLMRGR